MYSLKKVVAAENSPISLDYYPERRNVIPNGITRLSFAKKLIPFLKSYLNNGKYFLELLKEGKKTETVAFRISGDMLTKIDTYNTPNEAQALTVYPCSVDNKFVIFLGYLDEFPSGQFIDPTQKTGLLTSLSFKIALNKKDTTSISLLKGFIPRAQYESPKILESLNAQHAATAPANGFGSYSPAIHQPENPFATATEPPSNGDAQSQDPPTNPCKDPFTQVDAVPKSTSDFHKTNPFATQPPANGLATFDPSNHQNGTMDSGNFSLPSREETPSPQLYSEGTIYNDLDKPRKSLTDAAKSISRLIAKHLLDGYYKLTISCDGQKVTPHFKVTNKLLATVTGRHQDATRLVLQQQNCGDYHISSEGMDTIYLTKDFQNQSESNV